MLFLSRCVLMPITYIASGSMEPTIHSGSIVMVERSPLVRKYGRKDVVVFPDPIDSGILYCKRIIGMPGDVVEIVEGRTYINGEELSEPYLENAFTGSNGPFTVPDGCFFVMGDNRAHSVDSRFWSEPYIREEDIKGKVIVVWFDRGFCWRTLDEASQRR